MSTPLPVATHVIAITDTYLVQVEADPEMTDPDQVRLYKNRARVLLKPTATVGTFNATLFAHDHDLLEASAANGRTVTLQAFACHAHAGAPMPTSAPTMPSTPSTPSPSTPSMPSTPSPSTPSPSTPSPSSLPGTVPKAEGAPIRETLRFTGESSVAKDGEAVSETRTLRE